MTERVSGSRTNCWRGMPKDASRGTSTRHQIGAFSIQSVELETGLRLLCADAAGRDLSTGVVFATDWRSGDSTQHRDLPRMRERVSDRTLKEALSRGAKG